MRDTLAKSLDHVASQILQLYGLQGSLIALGNRGGFSGALLWQLDSLGAKFCLRAWPEYVDAGTLTPIHALMQRARQAGLAFVPTVLKTCDGATMVAHAGRVWDLTTWMPGRADFHGRPTPARLQNACTALGQVHVAWAALTAGPARCPAVERRRRQIEEWQELTVSGWKPQFDKCRDPALRFWTAKAWPMVRERTASVVESLEPWRDTLFPLQPCLCDPWHDHVLFEGDTVTGLIDYGSVKLDHVAVDLARLLGDLAGNDATLRSAGLEAYERVRALSEAERKLFEVLDFTGTVLSAAKWLWWLFVEERPFEDVPAVCRRLATLVERMEKW